MGVFRTLFVLGRPAYLPTVWSNCLAGWWLGGAGNTGRLPFLFAGATGLYFGAVYLNDAFDAPFDRQHRRGRPIPSGAISPRAVWMLGLAWLAVGLLLLWWPAQVKGILGLVLMSLVLLYNTFHRWTTLSPVVLGLCRFFVYAIAASAAWQGVTGWSIWCGLALAAYVSGAGFLEAQKEPTPYWPLLLLAFPVALALVMDADGYRESGLLLSAVLVLWCVRCLWRTYWPAEGEPVRGASGLVPGIVIVDWLAAADAPRNLSFIFIALFFLTIFLQKLAGAER